MNTLRKTFLSVHRFLPLLTLAALTAVGIPQVRGDEAQSDSDLLFECVQSNYGQNSNTENSMEFSIIAEEPEEVSEENVIPLEAAEEAPASVTAPVSEKSVVKNTEKTAAVEAPAPAHPVKTEAVKTETAAPAPTQVSAPVRIPAPVKSAERVAPVPVEAAPAPVQPVAMQEPIVPAPVQKGPVVREEPARLQPLEQQSQAVAPQSRIGSDMNDDDQSLGGDGETETVGPFQVYRESQELTVIAKRSMLMRTRYNLIRTAIVDPSICDIVQFTPREISIIGRSVGSTHVTFWFEDGTYKPVTFVVNTRPDPSLRDRRAEQFRILESQIATMFPNSKVRLTLLANKLIIRGQARSPEEAAEIMQILQNDINNSNSAYSNTAVTLDEETGLPTQQGLIIVNQLRVPGVQQVQLKVKLADLSRSSGTSSGVDFSVNFSGDKVMLQSLMGALTSGGGLLTYTSADVKIGIDYLVGNGVVRQMSESTIVTMSGTPAQIVSGGEIPITTTVGVTGAAAVTTDFRAYGTVISFLPTVLDKDLIRLQISGEFSALDGTENEVSGIPNLESRLIDSRVELREGQTFCLGTALEDNYSAENRSNIPIFSSILGHKSKSRGEREMVILVSPELVVPMEADEVPPLPGFDVTEPSNAQFHLLGRLEGTPTRDYRSTVWPSLRNRYLSGGSAIISGPYGH